MVRVYTEYYSRKYYAPCLSFGSFCCVLSFIILIVLPFLLSFATNKFWTKTNFYHEQPLVKPNGNVFMQVSTTAGNKYFSSIKAVQSQYQGYLLAPVIEVIADDHDGDGINDLITFRAKVPITTSTVRQVGVAFGVSYEFVDIAKTWFNASIFISASSAQGISAVSSTGTLALHQREPMKSGNERKELYYDENLFTLFEGRSFAEVLEMNMLRNQSVVLESNPIIMPYGEDSTLSVECIMSIPRQKVLYTPSMLEVLKFAWMQYLSFLLPIYAIMYSGLFWILYRNGAIDAKVIEDPIISRWEKQNIKKLN